MRYRCVVPVLLLILLLAASCWSVTLDLTPYAGQTVTVIVPGGDAVSPPTTPSDPETRQIDEFRFGVSDSKPGYMYFIIDGDHKSLTIGGEEYLRQGDYQGRALWYGKGSGKIILTGVDGTVYTGTTGESATNSGNRIQLRYAKNTNGNRPTYYTHDGRLLSVGMQVQFQVGNVARSFTAERRANGSIGKDWSDGTVVKNSDVGGRGIAVLIPASYASKPPAGGWIEW